MAKLAHWVDNGWVDAILKAKNKQKQKHGANRKRSLVHIAQ